MVLSLPDGRRGAANRPNTGHSVLDEIIARQEATLRNPEDQAHPLLRQLAERRVAPARRPSEADIAAEGGGLSSLIANIAGEVQGATTEPLPAGLGARIGAGIGTANPAQNTSDPLMEQMLGLLQAGAGGVDTAAYEAAMSDQAKAIRQGYGGQIRGLREEQDLARERGGENRGEVDKMYRALAKQYQREAKRSNRQGQRAANQITNRAAQSAEMLNESASGRNAEMVDRAAALGIGDALAGVLPESTEKDNAREAAIVGEGSRAANREAMAARSSNRALREGGMASRREGLDTTSGMMQDEEDFIRGIGREIQGLRSSRASDLASNRAAIAAQIAQAQGASNSDLFRQYLDLAKFQLDRDNTQNSNDLRRQELLLKMQGQQQQGGGNSAMPKALTNFNQLTSQLGPDAQSIVQDIINATGKDGQPTFGLTKGPGGATVPMNFAHMSQMLQRAVQERGVQLSPQEMEAAMGALMTMGSTVKW